KNQADQLIYSTEKSLKEFGDKVSQSDRLAIEQATRDLKDAIKSDDLGKIKRATEALTQASYKLAEELYKKSQKSEGKSQKSEEAEPAGQAHARPGDSGRQAGGKDDKVVDAEFKVEDEK
ncbi:MAG: Hsp70 family protein, partial [Candidatus Omnitrophica bacterium]|nr:Hsp70 family protein [Candidatus Omnitrophota bacterium]